MIPAYQISAEDLMELVYAVSQTGPDANWDDCQEFTGFSDRRLDECLKIGKELDLIYGEDKYTVSDSYRAKIDDVSREDRSVLLNRALIQYRPFRAFVAYIRKGYSPIDAARKTNVVHQIANDEEYILDYFLRFGKYTDLAEGDEDDFNITVESKEIPVDSVKSVEALRSAIKSEAQIRFYIEQVIRPEIASKIDEDTEDELVKAFSEHADDPRDSITASGRALEDFLREVCRNEGIPNEEIEARSGPTEVGNLMTEYDLIRDNQLKRIKALSAIRAKGGAHGDDQRTGDRWKTDAELALSVAMETTLLLRSIGKIVYEDSQFL